MLRIASPTEETTLMETKLKIQHLQYPFYHTIIYNCFEKSTLKSIISELQGFKKPAQHYVDEHHKSLGRTFNTEPFCLDNIYTNKRNKSPILQATQRTLDLKLDEHGASNPFLNYLPMTNKDTTFIQRYRAGSSYPNHHDGSVLTFLYLIKVKEHTGGNLIFSKYRPYGGAVIPAKGLDFDDNTSDINSGFHKLIPTFIKDPAIILTWFCRKLFASTLM